MNKIEVINIAKNVIFIKFLQPFTLPAPDKFPKKEPMQQ